MTDVLKNHLSRHHTTFLHVYCQENLVSVPPRGRKSRVKKKKPTKIFLSKDKVLERTGSREVLQLTAVRPKILVVPANSVSETQETEKENDLVPADSFLASDSQAQAQQQPDHDALEIEEKSHGHIVLTDNF
jgi:hypothetical protein